MVAKKWLLLLLVVTILSTSEAVFDSALFGGLVSKALQLWNSGQKEFVGHICDYRYRPKIKSWKLKYEGKFWCPGWAPFSGRSLRSSRSGAIKDAITHFANQAVNAKLVTEAEVRQWLH